ncbi:MAG: restriction endonuclease subunit S [Xanthomonadaceae bacterium]|nr:restriction endonuclease subunit S [Xanthomonadaceae bacterium]
MKRLGAPASSPTNRQAPMGMLASPTLVPKLRFPDFQDGPAWTHSAMGEAYSFKSNNSFSRDQLSYEQGLVRNIHYGDIHTKFSTLFDITKETVPFINRTELVDGLRRENDCIEGDMIFADASEDLADIGKSIEVVRLNGERVVAGQHTILARPNGENVAIGFGAYLFKSRYVRTQIEKESQGSKVLGISATRLAKIELPIPSTKAEQQKIAECLSTLDELIGAESQKLDALKAHKKGLMQQLFPREGETIPRLRFPEFQGAPEWEQRVLCEVTDSVFDGTHQTPTYVASGVPFYSVENLISGNANKFISREDYIAATRKNKPEKGDILLTRIGKVGYSRVVTWEHDFSVYVTLAVIKQSEFFDSHYLHFFFQSDRFQAELRSKSLPNAVPPKINLDSLRATIVLLPKAEEQQRIASCLSSLEYLIAAQSDQFEALKIHKKGLMQQLFPAPTESEE